MSHLFALTISNKQYKGRKSHEDFFVVIADSVPEAFARFQRRMTAGVLDDWVHDNTFNLQLMRHSTPNTIMAEGISWNSYLPDYTLYQEYDMTIQNKVITNVELRVSEEERQVNKRETDSDDDDMMVENSSKRARSI